MLAKSLEATEVWWRKWSARCTYDGPNRDAVLRSLITLKALTYDPTGGIVAAPTTSLPEQFGGSRNWDYRYCWLRDATFTLYALLIGGYHEEAQQWRNWLLRAVAGDPADIQILYGLGGERRIAEWEVPWLGGYEGAKPVRVGNAASKQLQLDVLGELMDSLHLARRATQDRRGCLEFATRPDRVSREGLAEARRRDLGNSWRAAAVHALESDGLGGCGSGDQRRRAIPASKGLSTAGASCGPRFTPKFVRMASMPCATRSCNIIAQDHEDAALLMIPLVGFLPHDDPRVVGTVRAIEKNLLRDGFVQRYPTRSDIDGLPPGEGVFLACSFWYVDNLALQGRRDEARTLFERLLGLANDVGLLSEEYDPAAKRLLGNFPQAFTHVALVNSARNLANHGGPATMRKQA